MAKIKARGAESLGTVQTQPEREDDMEIWYIFTLCSDGRVLKKSCWRADNGSSGRGAHRLWGRIRSPQQMNVEFLRGTVRSKGYKVA